MRLGKPFGDQTLTAVIKQQDEKLCPPIPPEPCLLQELARVDQRSVLAD